MRQLEGRGARGERQMCVKAEADMRQSLVPCIEILDGIDSRAQRLQDLPVRALSGIGLWVIRRSALDLRAQEAPQLLPDGLKTDVIVVRKLSRYAKSTADMLEGQLS